MKRVHYTAGVFVTIFILLHLFNHLYGLLGAKAHIELMNNLRSVYRNTIVEFILLAAIAVQFSTGIKLFLKKRKTATDFFEKLQVWSGAYLALFFLIHLGAVFTGRYVLNLDTNFYFGVAGLNTFPLNLFFIPYYGLAIISFFGHIAAVHKIKMQRSLLGISPSGQSRLILVLGVCLTVFIFYGLTNQFNGVLIPSAYHVLIGK